MCLGSVKILAWLMVLDETTVGGIILNCIVIIVADVFQIKKEIFISWWRRRKNQLITKCNKHLYFKCEWIYRIYIFPYCFVPSGSLFQGELQVPAPSSTPKDPAWDQWQEQPDPAEEYGHAGPADAACQCYDSWGTATTYGKYLWIDHSCCSRCGHTYVTYVSRVNASQLF